MELIRNILMIFFFSDYGPLVKTNLSHRKAQSKKVINYTTFLGNNDEIKCFSLRCNRKMSDYFLFLIKLMSTPFLNFLIDKNPLTVIDFRILFWCNLYTIWSQVALKRSLNHHLIKIVYYSIWLKFEIH